jgi:cephalosporin hydroxylase
LKDISAPADSQIILRHGGQEVACDLYSPQGRDLVAALWLKLAAQFRHMYEPRWLGVQIIQLPEDIVAMQELIWKVRPDLVIETGVAHGGSLILSASVLELIGDGSVIGVYVEIRKHNRDIIDAHPLRKRIHLIEGSSTDPGVVAEIVRRSKTAKRVLVILDSNHSAAHVAAELEAYAPLVTPDSYLVAMDGAQALVADIPNAKPEWREDHPLTAIRNFLTRHPEFVMDSQFERFGVTSSPEGYLRRLGGTEEQSR